MRKANTKLIMRKITFSTMLCGLALFASAKGFAAYVTEKPYTIDEAGNISISQDWITAKNSAGTVRYGLSEVSGETMGKVEVKLPSSQVLYYAYSMPGGWTSSGRAEAAGGGDITNVLFRDIETTGKNGGALWVRSNMSSITADFVNNSLCGGEGGVVYTISGIGTLTANFIGNMVKREGGETAHGGALYAQPEIHLFSISNLSGDFVRNSATSTDGNAEGGAIHTGDATVTIDNMIGDFIGNYAASTNGEARGGAVYNVGTLGNITGNFIGNYVVSQMTNGTLYLQGGAIYNVKKIGEMSGNFVGNYVEDASEAERAYSWGGAIYNKGTIGDLSQKTGITGDFVGNWVYAKPYAYGGAIYNDENATIGDIKGNFIGNYATSDNCVDSANSIGGAIYNSKNANIGDIQGDFVGNYAIGETSSGGAIHNAGTLGNIAGDFIGNFAKAQNATGAGGAIFNDDSVQIGSIKGNFIGNHVESASSAYGGAIYNWVDASITSITGNFTDNYANGTDGAPAYGGAILNLGTMTFTGENNFSGNYTTIDGGTTKVLNDIANADMFSTGLGINLKGTMNLDGGITAMSTGGYDFQGNLNIYGGSKIGFKIKEFGTGTLADSSKGTIIQGQHVTFKVGDDGSKIVTFVPIITAGNYVKGVTDKYTLFDTVGGTTAADPGYDLDSWKIENDLYKITFDITTGTFTFVAEEESKVKEKILAAGGSESDAILGDLLINPSKSKLSSNETFNAIQSNLIEMASLNDYASVVKATKSMNPDESPFASEVAVNNARTLFGLATSRMRAEGATARAANYNYGYYSQSGAYNQGGYYSQGNYNRNYQSSARSNYTDYGRNSNNGNYRYAAYGRGSGSAAPNKGAWAKAFYNNGSMTGKGGFDNVSYGVALGFDYTLGRNFTLGLGYGYGNSDVETDSRDVTVKTHTPFIYAEYRKNRFYIDGMLSYSFGKYNEDKEITGYKVDGEYDVNTLGAQVVGSYDCVNCLVPDIGFRYFHVNQKEYTDAIGNTFENKKSNVFTGLVGVRINPRFLLKNKYRFGYDIRLGLSYDFFRDDNEVDVTLANFHTYTFEGEKMSRFSFDVDAGAKIDFDNFSIGARYEAKFRYHYNNHTGIIEARYEF